MFRLMQIEEDFRKPLDPRHHHDTGRPSPVDEGKHRAQRNSDHLMPAKRRHFPAQYSGV
jgi:hypothetical protein